MALEGIERYITIKEAMDIMGIKSRTAFDRWCREAKVEKYKFGRAVRVRLNQIRDRAMSCRVA